MFKPDTPWGGATHFEYNREYMAMKAVHFHALEALAVADSMLTVKGENMTLPDNKSSELLWSKNVRTAIRAGKGGISTGNSQLKDGKAVGFRVVGGYRESGVSIEIHLQFVLINIDNENVDGIICETIERLPLDVKISTSSLLITKFYNELKRLYKITHTH